MTTITTRAGKGAPLTNAEVDANFTGLNAGKLEAADNLADLDDLVEARTNLGLGNAATKDVGTGAGNVAAGNHTHSFGLIYQNVVGTSQAAVAGNAYRLTNVAPTEVIFPIAPNDGDLIGVKVSNGLITNTVNPNGKTIEGTPGVMTLDMAAVKVEFRFSAAADYWEFV